MPTAATLEHVEARVAGGENAYVNYRLACPSCNSRKSDEPVEAWVARRGWELPVEELDYPTVTCMTHHRYGTNGRVIASGSTNARIVVEEDTCYVEVRASRFDKWHRFRLGAADHVNVIAAADDFLRRHHTPRVAVKTSAGRSAKRSAPVRKRAVPRT